MTGPSRAVRELVWDRDGGACVWCGRAVSPEWHSIHHRTNRGAGGSRRRELNLPGNLVLLHGTGTTGCHGLITCDAASAREAKRRGIVLSKLSIVPPAEVPVLYANSVWARIGDDGSWSAVGTPFSNPA
ncbi:HNH endonuclease [Nocardiopsis exhalans]|uniref:HNH endonuclease n=1 Tax=Nocardiopsis exhalans TaxID=163604 RepID=A0ABY5DBS2_9ACTN|nr:HNH endonuclease signature motif containing protein [Nocardiopsis exhalans]USY21799.1 HNH endonuclease [Nocardiopsis exhalans]